MSAAIKDYVPTIVAYLSASFAYTKELQSLGQAFHGAMTVRKVHNKNQDMHFFHAFVLTTLVAFGGGWFGFLWMGQPTSMIAGDTNLLACFISFVVVNYIPFGLGIALADFLPIKIALTSLSLLFRCTGMLRFITFAFNALKDTSPYYPIPVLGPIVYGTLLGNMTGFFFKGVDGYLGAGIPWAFQNGLIMGAFFHFFVHDETGPIGTFLRDTVHSVGDGVLLFGLDDRTFATVVVSLSMQIVGILQLPEFLGPSFSPFTAVADLLLAPLIEPKKIDKVIANGSEKIPKKDQKAKKEPAVKKEPKEKKEPAIKKELVIKKEAVVKQEVAPEQPSADADAKKKKKRNRKKKVA